MDVGVIFFLTSGLFLGWALGTNDAANVFGTAVGSRMLRFSTAAIICSIFVILGAVISGGGTSHTLGKLGAVNALPGSFMVALAAALAVYLMTKTGISVSTTQAIVGSIMGWNLFSSTPTDTQTLSEIVATWFICPVLAGTIAAAMFKLVVFAVRHTRLHMLHTDALTRIGLVLAGAFGAYSLGANNIANVVGVFVPASPFTEINVGGLFTLSSAQQLFLLGSIAIAVGVMTYSRRVMMTVGRDMIPLPPIAAWVAVVAHSVVLFVFASRSLESYIASWGLPTPPLVPVSSTQALVGAVIGIALVRGGRDIRWPVVGSVVLGWVVTPVIAGLVCFIGLFFLQNVFDQRVHEPVRFTFTDAALTRIADQGIETEALDELRDITYLSEADLRTALDEHTDVPPQSYRPIIEATRRLPIRVSPARFARLHDGGLDDAEIADLKQLSGQEFTHPWQLAEALADISPRWRPRDSKSGSLLSGTELREKLEFLVRVFTVARE